MTSPTEVQTNIFTTQLERIDDQLRAERPREAEALAAQFVEKNPENVDGWILLGRAQQDLKLFEKALESGLRATALDPKHPVARLLMIDGSLCCGRSDDAFEAAKKLEMDRKNDPAILLQIGYF